MDPSEDEENIALIQEKNDNPLPTRIFKSLTLLCEQEKFLDSSKILLDYINRELPKSLTDVEFPEGISFILKKLISELSKDGVQNNACYATLQTLLQLHSQIMLVIFSMVKVIYPTEDKNPLGYLLARGALTKSNALLKTNAFLKGIISDIGAMDYEGLNHIAGQFLFDLILKDTDGTIVACAWNVHKNSLNQLVKNLTTSHKWLSIGLSKPEYKKYKILPEEFYKNIFGAKGFKSLCTTFKDCISSGADIYPIIETYYESFIAYEDEKFQTHYKNTDAECPGLDKMVAYCVSYIPNTGENFCKINEATILMIKHLLPYLTRPVHIAQVFSPRFLGFLTSDMPHGETIKLKQTIEDLLKAIYEKYIPTKEDPDCVTSVVLVRQLVLACGFAKLNNSDGILSKNVFKALSTMDQIMILRLATILAEIFKTKTMDELAKFESNAEILTGLIFHLLSQRGINSTDYINLKAEMFLLIYRFCCLKLPSYTFSIVNLTLHKAFFTSLMRTKKLEDLILYLEIIFIKIQAAPLFQSRKVDSEISQKLDKVYQQAADNRKLFPAHRLTVMAVAHIFMIYQFISDACCPTYTFEIQDLLEVVLKSKTSHKKCLEDDYELTDDSQWTEATLKLCLHVLIQNEKVWKKFLSMICKFISPFIKPSSLYIIADEFKCYPENISKEEIGEDSDSSSDDEDDSEEDMEEAEEVAISQVKDKMMEIVEKVSDGMDDIELEDVKPNELMRLDARLGAFFPDSDTKKNPRSLRAQRSTNLQSVKYCLRISSFIEEVIENAPSMDHLAFFMEPLLHELAHASEDKVFDPLIFKIRNLLKAISHRASHPSVRTLITLDLKEEMMKLLMIQRKLHVKFRKELEMGYLFYLRCGINLANSNEDKKGITDELYEIFAQHTEAMIMNPWPYALEKPLTLTTPSTSILLHKIVILGFDSSLAMSKRILCMELICYSFLQHDVILLMPPDKLHDICNLITKGIVKDFTPDLPPTETYEKHLIRMIDMIKILKKRARKYSENTMNFTEIMDAIVAFIEKFPDLHYTRLRRSMERLKQSFQMKSNSGSMRLLRKKRYISEVEEENKLVEEDQNDSENEMIEKVNTHLAASRQRKLKKIEARIDVVKSKLPEEILVPVSKNKAQFKPRERIDRRRLRILEGIRENLLKKLSNTPKKKAPRQTLVHLGARPTKKKKNVPRSKRRKKKLQKKQKLDAT